MKRNYNVLYIYGYNGSPEGNSFKLLKSVLPKNYKLYSFEYSQNDAIKAREEIYNFVNENNIDLIIGSSLGGFLTLTFSGLCRFVINPCMKPSVELPKLGASQNMTNSYASLEHYIDDADIEDRIETVGFFGDNDELFGDKYRGLFKKQYKNLVVCKGGHHMSEDIANNIVNNLDSYWNKIENYNKQA